MRPSQRLLLLSLPFAASLLVTGCDCSGTIGGDPCDTDDDCDRGQTCVDGECRTPTDRRDSGRPDCRDEDGDGRCADVDCDDTNAMRGGAEVCDEIDNDCDGNVDEGVPELCADCAPGCEAQSIPGPGGWTPDDENSDGVIVDDGGALTLGRNEATAFAVWIANSQEGTVSKLDSRTGAEVARYPSVGAGAPAGVPLWSDVCNSSNIGNCPSRTAVDQNFDAYVANRAFGNQGSVTKYANRETDCVDRNVNGVIDTSRDLDGNGRIDIGTAEFVGPDDECILWTAAVGAGYSLPRALTIGLAPPDSFVGDVWVGLFNQRQACRLDPVTGATRACMDIANYNTYGMAADSANRIWLADRSGGRRDVVGYIDTGAMTFTPVAALPDLGGTCAIPYGITVDGAGDVFIANQCDPSVWRYRPSTGEWTPVDAAAPFSGTPRGVAADETHLWVALSHDGDGFGGSVTNRIRQYLLSDLSFVAEHRSPGSAPIGIGVSFDGSIWAINQSSSSAARFEPTTGAWTEHPVGVGPYTYSDFIGFGLNVFAEPRGHYSFIVEGCDSGVQIWRGARYVAEVPPSTEVTLFARTADTVDALAAEAWVGPFTGNPASFLEAPGPLPNRRYLQVDIRLSTTDRTTAPRVLGIDVAGVCEPIIE